MTWFKVDDGFPGHPKVRSIPRSVRMRVVGVWAACGAWSARYLTDGLIAGDAVEDEGGEPTDAKALVAAGLWHEHGHDCPRCVDPVAGSFVFHDWSDWNPTKEKVKADRKATADRVARYRERKNGGSNGVTNGVSNGAPGPARPGPTRKSLLTLISRLAASDASASDGPPPAEVIDEWQEIAGAGVDLEVEAKAYLARFGDRPAKDERGAWLGWLRRAAVRSAEARNSVPGPPGSETSPPGGCGAPGCVEGYLGFDDDERPRPCPDCRPHLRPVAS